MAIDKKPLDYMRDCVKQALFKGCQRGHEFRKMRHAIIVEARRLNYSISEIKDIMLEWNNRCERRLPPAEVERYLLKYVDWVFKQEECRIGCRALKDYCIGEGRCEYHLRIVYRNRQKVSEPPFSMEELDKYLTRRFKADGYVMMLVVKAMYFYQQEQETGEIMLVGLRTIGTIIRDKHGHRLEPMSILRRLKLLIEEGIVEQVAKGKSGTCSHLANGYRFLPWRPPQPITTHINPMCNTES